MRYHLSWKHRDIDAVMALYHPEVEYNDFFQNRRMRLADLREYVEATMPKGPDESLEQARRLGAVVTGSLIVQLADGSHRNRLLWARPDGEMLHYDKRHLFRMAGEHEHYSPGERQELFELKGWRVRPLICYDLRFPVWSRDPHDTDLLLYTANWPAPRRQHWNRLLPARAIENLCYVVAVNRIGEDGNALRYAGDSQVLDFQGDSLFNAADADGVFRVRLDAAALAAYRQRFPAYMDADRFEIHP
ncbi:amidohydrolase [Pseudomonas aeruginosa]|nr:amidohydrolase [Pseudomonas aeruginosa]